MFNAYLVNNVERVLGLLILSHIFGRSSQFLYYCFVQIRLLLILFYVLLLNLDWRLLRNLVLLLDRFGQSTVFLDLCLHILQNLLLLFDQKLEFLLKLAIFVGFDCCVSLLIKLVRSTWQINTHLAILPVCQHSGTRNIIAVLTVFVE